eukprot:TRINITY_DN114230_c0_g1_i1.p1 TRINITY_DN114230_c0_g1~~TRINITY_DN114230_c0_g1_i1.p1  ORF type:complete len:387 (-),score=19.83 TRINITY_DN114230_c0_g1_i1:5-1165(-)
MSLLTWFPVVFLCLCVAGSPDILAHDHRPTLQPRVTGFFYELYHDVLDWSYDDWGKELEAMKAIGVDFFSIRSVFSAYFPNYTMSANREHYGSQLAAIPKDPKCPYGHFSALYPSNITNCAKRTGYNPLPHILKQADRLHLQVHIGLAFPDTVSARADWWAGFASLSGQVFKELHTLFGKHKSWVGTYIVFESSNLNTNLDFFRTQAKYFLEPLSSSIKSVAPHQVVWGSPYYRGKKQVAPSITVMTPEEYANAWGTAFSLAPHFDFIALQDGVGCAKNSTLALQYVQQYLPPLIQMSIKHGRPMWSNAEAFHFAIHDGHTNCKTIRPVTPFSRYIAQLKEESAMAGLAGILSWEWHAYFSPYSKTCAWSSAAKNVYDDYKSYINE